MIKQPYKFLEIDVCLWEEKDVITLSSSGEDDQKENDVTGDDIFGS